MKRRDIKIEREDIWIILGIVIMCALMAVFGWVVADGIITAKEHKKIVNQAIGSTIIIGRDTLEIVNYQRGGLVVTSIAWELSTRRKKRGGANNDWITRTTAERI